MIAKITKKGLLKIKRGDKFYAKRCPYNQNSSKSNFQHCGDWCALFGEADEGTYEDDAPFSLNLCYRILYLEEFLDERENS